MAKRFEAHVAEDPRFEVVVPRRFALVCFRLRPKQEEDETEMNSRLVMAVNGSGRAFITHAVVGGIYVTEFENSTESGTTRPSRSRLKGVRIESDTRYDTITNSVLNRPNSVLNSDDSAENPS